MVCRSFPTGAATLSGIAKPTTVRLVERQFQLISVSQVIHPDGHGRKWCSNSQPVVVTEIPELEPAISGELQFCAGTSTTLRWSLVIRSYTIQWFQWLFAATVTVPGNISLTVIDNSGCEGTAGVAVSELSFLNP